MAALMTAPMVVLELMSKLVAKVIEHDRAALTAKSSWERAYGPSFQRALTASLISSSQRRTWVKTRNSSWTRC